MDVEDGFAMPLPNVEPSECTASSRTGIARTAHNYGWVARPFARTHPEKAVTPGALAVWCRHPRGWSRHSGAPRLEATTAAHCLPARPLP